MIHQPGTVLLMADVLDPQGGNLKNRPVVLLDEWDDTTTGYALAVCITSFIAEHLSEVSVAIPFSNAPTRCTTGLTVKSVALCTWKIDVGSHTLIRRMGAVPALVLAKIYQIIDQVGI